MDFSRGLYDDAVIQYRNAIKKDPHNGEAYYRLALAEQRRGNMTQALKVIVTARDLLPNREDIQTQSANFEMEAYLADSTHPAKLYQDLQQAAGRFLARDPKSYEGIRIKALLAWTDGELKSAIEFFREADHSKPGQADLIASWCQTLFQNGQFQEGERRAFDAIRAQPGSGAIYDVLANEYYARHRPADAVNIVRMKAANNPARIDYALQLASWYAGSGERGKMKAELDRLIAHPEMFPNAQLAVGDFYANLQNWDEAIRLYQEGAAAYPRSRIAYLKRLCDAWLAEGKLPEAAAIAREIVRSAPRDEAARAVNDSLAVSGVQPERAKAALEDLGELVRENPRDPVWRFTYARALMDTGDLDAASRQFQETLKARPDFFPSRLALARIGQTKGDYRQTLEQTDEILKYRPDLLEARLLRIAGLIGTERYGIARAELAVLAKDYPGNSEVQFQFASADLAQLKFDEAESRLEKLASIKELRPRALEGLTAVYKASNRSDKAYSMLSAELVRSPDSDAVRSMTAEAALRSGKYDEAFRLYQELVQRNPRSATFRKLLGAVYQVKGDIPAAIVSYQKAIDLAPKEPSMLSALADALRIAGRKTDAIVAYRRLLEISPDNTFAMNNLAFLLADGGTDLDKATELVERWVTCRNLLRKSKRSLT